MAAVLASAFAPASASAQSVSSETITRGLTPPPVTRGLTRSIGQPAAAPAGTREDAEFLKALPTRGIRIDQREKLEQIAEKQKLPRIEMDITFDYDSDRIKPASIPDVNELGKALIGKELAASRLVLNGHTDGAGSADYNQVLSERRAAAVRAYLIERFGISADRLIAIGYGKERPKNTSDPLAPENRRVEIINLTSG